jgi:hypothetical protein
LATLLIIRAQKSLWTNKDHGGPHWTEGSERLQIAVQLFAAAAAAKWAQQEEAGSVRWGMAAYTRMIQQEHTFN